jgi:hypothetical protein
MRTIGFSTGALACSDFQKGLDICRMNDLTAIELSALREPELDPLIEALPDMDLSGFSFISIHAPSAITIGNEHHVVEQLRHIKEEYGWPIVVHPDIIQEPELWVSLSNSLCIENMDKRKPIGRTPFELHALFDQFPDASFCLDLGHARQCDPTMIGAHLMIKLFSPRLKHIHLSNVTTNSEHDRLSRNSILSFQEIAGFIPERFPIIMESRISKEDEVMDEVHHANEALPSLESTKLVSGISIC